MERLDFRYDYPGGGDEDYEDGEGGWSRHREDHGGGDDTGFGDPADFEGEVDLDPVGGESDYGEDEGAETDQAAVGGDGWKRRARAGERGQRRVYPGIREYRTPVFVRAADLRGTLKVERPRRGEEYIPMYTGEGADEDLLADQISLQRTLDAQRAPREEEYIPMYTGDAADEDFL